ncbi:unnamed protein product [Rhizophagus irregularis]|nr:unnamed protein product [Rhizophagus irregularis]CAB5134388.1 unnamed protein product [Rhizophagus irregularis]
MDSWSDSTLNNKEIEIDNQEEASAILYHLMNMLMIWEFDTQVPDDWTVLRTTAERCLQFLSKLDSNELHKIGELVKPKEFLTMMTRICSYFY